MASRQTISPQQLTVDLENIINGCFELAPSLFQLPDLQGGKSSELRGGKCNNFVDTFLAFVILNILLYLYYYAGQMLRIDVSSERVMAQTALSVLSRLMVSFSVVFTGSVKTELEMYTDLKSLGVLAFFENLFQSGEDALDFVDMDRRQPPPARSGWSAPLLTLWDSAVTFITRSSVPEEGKTMVYLKKYLRVLVAQGAFSSIPGSDYGVATLVPTLVPLLAPLVSIPAEDGWRATAKRWITWGLQVFWLKYFAGSTETIKSFFAYTALMRIVCYMVPFDTMWMKWGGLMYHPTSLELITSGLARIREGWLARRARPTNEDRPTEDKLAQVREVQARRAEQRRTRAPSKPRRSGSTRGAGVGLK